MRLLAAVALAGALALGVACGDDDDDEDDDGDGNTPAAQTTRAAGSPTTAATSAATSAATTGATPGTSDGEGTTIAVVQDATLGAILTDGDGFTLYTFTNDTANSGESACSGACAQAWPPLEVDGEPTAPPQASGELETITRDDGTTQVTYNGMPLYRFASDAAPGETNGQGVGGVWFVAEP
jgi:predicted lipoprotein with Yx(FWY)xxD motif